MSRADVLRAADAELLRMVLTVSNGRLRWWIRDPAQVCVWYGQQWRLTVDEDHVRDVLLRHPRVVTTLRAWQIDRDRAVAAGKLEPQDNLHPHYIPVTPLI